MAKNQGKNVPEEKTFKAVSRQFIKYDGEFIKTGGEFQVKESDVDELKAFADIEIPKENTPPPVDPEKSKADQGEGQGGQQEAGENGGQ